MNNSGTITAEASLEGTLTSYGTLNGDVSGDSSLEGSITIYAPKTNYYTGPYEVIPKADEDQELNTADKTLTQNVEIKQIPTYKTSNESGGYTFYIGGE